MTQPQALEFVDQLIEFRVQVTVDFDGRLGSYRLQPRMLVISPDSICGDIWHVTFHESSDDSDGVELMEFIDYIQSGNIRLVAKSGGV